MLNEAERDEKLGKMELIQSSCGLCNTTYNLRQLLDHVILSDWPQPNTPEYYKFIPIKCSKCKVLFFVPVDEEFHPLFVGALTDLNNEYRCKSAHDESIEDPSKYFMSVSQPAPNPPPRPFLLNRCTNPECSEIFNKDEAQAQISKHGMEFAHCGDIIYQVVRCHRHGCNGRIYIKCKANSPVLDMSKLLLMPHRALLVNATEQSWIIKNSDSWHPFLQFNYLQAWSSKSVSEDNFIACFNSSPLEKRIYYGPRQNAQLFMTEDDLRNRISMAAEKLFLRNLCPDIPKFRDLFTCLAPYTIRDIPSRNVSNADGTSKEDIVERQIAWKRLLENATGMSLEESFLQTLGTKMIEIPPNLDIPELIRKDFFFIRSSFRDHLWDFVFRNGFEEKFDSIFQRLFKKRINTVCTNYALSAKREELVKWVDEVEKGKALFVDAPMGIGKTFSIVETLSSYSELSAVIFMPTKHLCEKLEHDLKSEIAIKKGLNSVELERWYEHVLDESGNYEIDSEGFYRYKFKRDFLKSEVYYVDGINPQECKYFGEFIERYKRGIYTKSDICENCEKFKGFNSENICCRFRRHIFEAPLSRVIITTHHQYSNFSRQTSMKKWFKNGYYKKDDKGKVIKDENGKSLKADGIDRSFFIIDEDIVLSQLYEPICLSKEETRAFVSTISDFLARSENIHDDDMRNTLINNVDRVLAQFEKCGTTSLVPPIDPKCTVPHKIKKLWLDELVGQDDLAPEFLGWSEPIGNYLDFFENAIRKGFAIQNYEVKYEKNGQTKNLRIKNAFFPNPRNYNLSRLPPHVFFDGTMINNEFLENKLHGVEFKRIEIIFDPIWDIRIYQNIWTDLAKYAIIKDQSKVQQYVSDLLCNLGKQHKYFFVTKKDVREKYLEEWLYKNFPDYDFVIEHYGNLRGKNTAMDCDVGIMLGSFSPPDVLEIAMALDFIQDKLPPNIIIPTEGKDNIWTRAGVNFTRSYNKDFEIVGEMANIKRLSEHRQALARTRYLFHDVDFYILSKDHVRTYEPYLPEPETTNYRKDLFAKQFRKDRKYDEVKEKVFEYLESHETVIAMDIDNNYGIWRKTVSKYLKEMYEEGLLEKKSKTIYRLPKNGKPNGQNTLY